MSILSIAVARCAMRFLLRPSKKMEGALEPLQDKLRGKFSLGLQLRLNDETAQACFALWWLT
jgi:hypothetical protein